MDCDKGDNEGKEISVCVRHEVHVRTCTYNDIYIQVAWEVEMCVHVHVYTCICVVY